MTPDTPKTEPALQLDVDPKTVSRRRALARLGLVAGAVYVAPTITNLDRRALANTTPCPKPWEKGPRPPHCRQW
jgi:hypothetical protein